MSKTVFLFNTASRKKEPFQPIQPGHAKVYACGPTVYHFAHIGNLRTYIWEDVLIRTLRHSGLQVTHALNITDVGHLVTDGDEGDDKMEQGSAREGKTAWEVAEFYTKAFFSDFDKLGCVRPQIICKATDYIQEMIDLVQCLDAKGFTYKTSDGIYFDTVRFPRYRDFARLDVENLEAGKRISVGEKRSSTDFALWKFSPSDKKRQMEWDSPWGKGFPGWHIECSAMSMKHFGTTFDIHCGGKDHIPVHHTNEIAQSEAATGVKYANFWLHGEFLNESAGKMSKSSGEFLTVSVLEKNGFRPANYRFLVLQAHYRTELQFSWDSLTAAQAGLNGILNRMESWGDSESAHLKEDARAAVYRSRFESAIYDDLNTPIALTILFESLKDTQLSTTEKRALLKEFDTVLGIGFEAEFEFRKKKTLPDEVLNLVKLRDSARNQKNWKESDRIRDLLIEKGYRVEDSPGGTRATKD